MQEMNAAVRRFWDEEDGLGTLEVLLIVAVLVILAIAFRKWLMKWVQDLFSSADSQITGQSGSIQSDANSISP